MKTNEKRSILVLAILLVAFSVIAFAVPFAKNGAFWPAYVFGVISIAGAGYAAYTGFVKGDAARSRLYGFPVARVGFVYMVVQLILSIIFMALAAVIPAWVVIIVCVLALAAAAVGLITTEAMREEIERQDVQLKKDVTLMRGLQSKMQSVVSQSGDAPHAAALRALSEELRYSDPVSNDAAAGAETELSALVDELQRAVLDCDADAIPALCKRTSAVLAERNRLCRLNK